MNSVWTPIDQLPLWKSSVDLPLCSRSFILSLTFPVSNNGTRRFFKALTKETNRRHPSRRFKGKQIDLPPFSFTSNYFSRIMLEPSWSFIMESKFNISYVILYEMYSTFRCLNSFVKTLITYYKNQNTWFEWIVENYFSFV